MKKALTLLAILTVLPTMAGSALAAENNECWVSNFTGQDHFAQGVLLGSKSDTIALQHDGDDGKETGSACPSRDETRCPPKQYLAGGDPVIVSRSLGEFSCVWYAFSNNKGLTGWVSGDQLKTLPTETHPAIERWVGNWVGPASHITIAADGTGALKLEGEAVFGASSDSPHIGTFLAVGSPKGNELSVKDDYDHAASGSECTVHLTLLTDYLVAKDNGNCGGRNVTFSGVLARQ